MDEIFKDILEYEGLYQISNNGVVRSLDRIVNGNYQNPYRKLKGKIIKSCIDGMGYKRVNLLKDNYQKSFTIHRLIAIHFIDNPLSYLEINHIDGNKINNDISNLEWIDHKGNMIHARDTKLISYNKKGVIQYDLHNNEIARFESIVDASKTTNIPCSSIRYYCNFKNVARGFIWKYANFKPL